MAPITRSKKKKDLESSSSRAQSDSSRGTKRSAEEGENEKTGESNTEKRGRPAEKESHTPLEIVKEENEQKEEETEKKMEKDKEESSDSSNSETSFMDLPDDCHRNIFSFLGLPSSLNLRVNKRLDRLQLSVKYKMEKIRLIFARSQCQLIIDNLRLTLARSSSCTHWIHGLRRIAVNTFVNRIFIYVDAAMNEQYCRVIEALFRFKSNFLRIHPSMYNISHLTLPSFLTLAQNVREVEFHKNISLTVQDLCTIRKTMLDGGCVMNSFKCPIRGEITKPFLKECFGLTLENVLGPLRGEIYHSANESLEMYRAYSGVLQYFEGNHRTIVNIIVNCISFMKLEGVNKPDDQFKIRWNHFYRDT